ncbi:hypothetical protein SCP_0704750 [Sparassis crispa]|uniref:Uncharacterized protein n=1 Tax=Sparassis crispa TaxID=139825 RepID=A0A401GSS6_9APHY|nr:hypothetical protein SCP_0704750 [Sparassis crispa]GBE85288.1 hypothetical protein SCP_0704750 [Sparassis crispa]
MGESEMYNSRGRILLELLGLGQAAVVERAQLSICGGEAVSGMDAAKEGADAVCRAGEEEVVYRFGVIVAGRAGLGGKAVDAEQMHVEGSMAHLELDEEASMMAGEGCNKSLKLGGRERWVYTGKHMATC